MFFGPCFQVEAIVDGFTTNNNLLKLLSSYDCCSQNNYFSKNHKHKRTLREAFKKITILLLTFVNNGTSLKSVFKQCYFSLLCWGVGVSDSYGGQVVKRGLTRITY